jgi:malonyl CoA-acyl carrier protein transacylase/acyl carrier protein
VSRTCFLFPGLGGYLPGALVRLAAEHTAVMPALAPIEQAAREYGHEGVVGVLTDPHGPEIEELARTPARFHLATVGISLAVHAVLDAEGIRPDVMAGNSTGELSALASSGWLTAYDAARVVREREAAIAEVAPEGGLAALHTGAERAASLCGATGDWTVTPALFTSPRQTVVAGSLSGLTTVESLARVVGVAVTPLPAIYPHHSPLMKEAARRTAEASKDYPVGVGRCRVYSPILRRFITNADDVRALVATHLSAPVYYAEAVQRLYADAEVDRFVEAGARSILSDLTAQTLPPGIQTIAPLRGPVGVNELLSAIRAPGNGRVPTPPPSIAPPPAVHATTASTDNGAATADELPTDPPIVSAAPSSEPSPQSGSSLPPRPQLHSELRQLFAEVLGYPEDVFEDDAHLEADLGIASVRKTELLVKVLDRYGLPTPSSEMRLRDYNTLPKLVDLVYLLAQRTPAGAERGL